MGELSFKSTSAVAVAPLPLLQLSVMVTNGGDVKPDPKLLIFTPTTLPIEFTTAFPTAPEPPPPNIVSLGGPHLFVNGSHPPIKLFILVGIPPDTPCFKVRRSPETPDSLLNAPVTPSMPGKIPLRAPMGSFIASPNPPKALSPLARLITLPKSNFFLGSAPTLIFQSKGSGSHSFPSHSRRARPA